MKRLMFGMIAAMMIFQLSYCYADNNNVHDSSFDNKSINKINLDDPNTVGVVTVKPVAGNTSNTTVSVPVTNGTLLTNVMHDNTNLTGGVNWTDAFLTGKAVNWSDIRAYATSFGGDHSGINWQSFGK